MQEEVTNKTIGFYVKGGKITASVLKMLMMKYLQAEAERKKEARQQQMANKRIRQQNKQAKKDLKAKQGKTTMGELAVQNKGMVNIEITSKNIKSFERYARKYGIQFALKKDKTKDPPVHLVFFKAQDQDAITSAFREFTHAQVKKANRPSIHQRLEKYKKIAEMAQKLKPPTHRRRRRRRRVKNKAR